MVSIPYFIGLSFIRHSRGDRVRRVSIPYFIGLSFITAFETIVILPFQYPILSGYPLFIDCDYKEEIGFNTLFYRAILYLEAFQREHVTGFNTLFYRAILYW